MINLLSEKNKTKLVREYRLKKVVIFEVIVFILIIISLIVLGTLYYTVFLEGENNEDLLEGARRDASGETLSTLQAEAKDLRGKLAFFSRFDKDSFPVADLVEDIVLQKPRGVHIFKISFSRDEERILTVRGNADTRETFLLFVSNLEVLSFVENVDSPVTNIIQETEVPFTVNIKIVDDSNNE